MPRFNLCFLAPAPSPAPSPAPGPAPPGRLARLAALALPVGAAICLAACNETGGPALGPVTAATAPAPDSPFRLPPGAPCSGEINRFHAVVKGDLDTGNVERKVYDQIERDLGQAATACSAGRGGEAHAIVAASKARHGYRA